MNHFTRRRLLGGVTDRDGRRRSRRFRPWRNSRPKSTCRWRRRPPRAEVVPVLPAERVEVERWQPGYWRWNGYEHVWTEGHYVDRPRPRAEWIPGRWEQRPRGWVYVEGHWN